MIDFPYRSILVVRTDAIGDLILSEPVAQAIKFISPDCKVTYMVSDYAAPVLAGNPCIDRIIALSGKGLAFSWDNIRKAAGKIKSSGCDAAVILRPTLFNALTVFMSGIKIRIGTGYRAYSVLFNRKVYEHRSKNLKSEMMYNIALLQGLNIDDSKMPAGIRPRIHLTAEDSFRAGKYLLFGPDAASRPDKREFLVVIHPGGRGSAPRWPLANFLGLIEKMDGLDDTKLIITGSENDFSEDELAELRESISEFGGRIIDLIGKTDLKGFISIISESDLVVTNSTGTAHMAAAVDIPLVTIYPDSADYSLSRWAPVGDADKISIVSASEIERIEINAVYDKCLDFYNRKVKADG
jgi:ADP-heptose:LPS heptosyltransferase